MWTDLACGSTRLVLNVRRNVMKFTVTIDRDEDGVWIAECPAIFQKSYQ